MLHLVKGHLMPRCHGSFICRASQAFASLAVSCGLAIVALLALTLGVLQDTHADGVTPDDVTATAPQLTLPVFEPAAPAVMRKVQPRDASTMPWISRREASLRSKESPAREMFGLSKVAFPLLVSDVVPVDASSVTVVTSGSTVGVR
jgi:hypothetical protein